MAKNKIVTPRGELSWIYIDGEGKLNELSDKNEFTATITMSKADAQPLIDSIHYLWNGSREKSDYDELMATAKPAVAKKVELRFGYKEVLDDKDNPTDFVSFQFKTGTTFPDGAPVTIRTYNARGKKVNLGETKVGNGSIGKISGTISTYGKATNYGVGCYLSALQIIKLIAYTEDAFDNESEDGAFENVDEEESATDMHAYEGDTDPSTTATDSVEGL